MKGVGFQDLEQVLSGQIQVMERQLKLWDSWAIARVPEKDKTIPEFYELNWEPHHVNAVESSGEWLIFAGEDGFARALAEHLKAGDGMVSVFGESDESELRAKLESLQQPAFLIYLGGLTAVFPREPSLEALHEDRDRVVLPFLHLIQVLESLANPIKPKLWAVTRGARSLGCPEALPCLSLAPIWGLGRTRAAEYPMWGGGLIDLDPSASEDEMLVVDAVLSG